MIKVQTLRLRGLCASSLLALAACSGTSSGVVRVETNSTDGTPMTGSPAAESPNAATPAAMVQDPQGQNPDSPEFQKTRRKALVDKAVENARRSLDLRLFEDARNEAAFALELDANNEAARDILRRCQGILGDTPSTSMTSRLDEAVLIDRIRLERERATVASDKQLGNAHMQEGNFGKAIQYFEKAVTTLRYSPFAQANDAERRECEALLAKARDAKNEAERASLERAKTASDQELARLQRDQALAREQQVARLLDEANLEFQASQYERAVNLVDQALLLDATNPTATALREVADRARHGSKVEAANSRWAAEWSKTFLELQHGNVPQTETVVFDPARWSEVSRRTSANYASAEATETPENVAILRRLEETALEHNFPSATIQDWANYYQQLTGVTFFVTQEVRDLPAEQTTLTDFRLPRRSVASALQNIQSQTGVAFKVRDGMVHLVGPANATGLLFLKPYRIADLVHPVPDHPGPELRLPTPGDDRPLFPEEEEATTPSVVDVGKLQDLLKATVATEKWDGNPFSMSEQAGVLLVRADKETHAKVDHMLGELRKHVGIQIDVESRFLRVEDSFLEDVGIDLRGLGNQAATGLAGRGLEKNGDRTGAGFDDFGPRQQQNAASPGLVGTGTEPGAFFDDGGDGDMMLRTENLYNATLGGRYGGLTRGGPLSREGNVYANDSNINSSLNNAQGAASNNGGLNNAGGLSLQYAYLDDTEVEVVLRAVAKQERGEQIDAPRLLIYNNTRCSMSHLRHIAYVRDFEVEIAQAAAVANPVIGVVQDGVALDVRPVVDANLRFVTMELRPTVMTLQLPIPTFTTTLGVGQPISIHLPEVTLQKVRTTVTIPDGGTMMLGGMRLVERENLRSTVPLLGNLPGLSWLFSRTGTSYQNRKILILIRAKIILMDEQEPLSVKLPDGSVVSARSR